MKNFFYRVNKGDTALLISQVFSMPTIRLIERNNLVSEVEEGDLLIIEKCDSAYVVKPTDTKKSLAKKFNVCESELLEIAGFPYIFSGLVIEI
ncbi:MAG: LysM peptidoglycan-binding domain-containing protein [Clostridia bacterium]|nr:LysM peptidoglycan-binding domain-containing protein [Clostridia bacterium]